MAQLPRLLIVDHHDSYTLNLLALLVPEDATDAKQEQERCSQLSQQLAERVVVLPHNHEFLKADKFHRLVRPHIDAIILSPGPGSPDNPADFGAAEALLRDPNLELPVLGVCLGHQGLATAFGGRVVRAQSVRHGLKTSLCLADNKDSTPISREVRARLMDGVPEGTEVIRYNSLTVDEDALPDCLRVTAWGWDDPCPAPPPRSVSARSRADRFSSRPGQKAGLESGAASPQSSVQLLSGTSSPHRLPEHSSSLSESSSLGELEEDLNQRGTNFRQRVVLALEHETLPFYGVQFHPESIESQCGRRMMDNFLTIVSRFHQQRGQSKSAQGFIPEHLRKAGEACVSLGTTTHNQIPAMSSASNASYQVLSETLELPTFDGAAAAPAIFDALFQHESPVGAAWLDTARTRDPHSRFSYMAIPSFALSYRASSRQLLLDAHGDRSRGVPINMASGSGSTSFWDFIDHLQTQLQDRTDYQGSMDSPDMPKDTAQTRGRLSGSMFRTGFVGYWGYEMKGESLGLDSPVPSSSRGDPDAEFLFCNRMLAYDHLLNKFTAFVLADSGTVSSPGGRSPLDLVKEGLLASKAVEGVGTPSESGQKWLQHVRSTLSKLASTESSIKTFNRHELGEILPPLTPQLSAEEYKYQIESARELIAAGESYELCLTTQFQGTLAAGDQDHFGLYIKLRARNPAPYSAFLRLPSEGGHSRSIISTSPERFMRITKEGAVEMKPIKGTLARAGYGPGEEEMRAGGSGADEEAEKRAWRESEDARRCSRLAADMKERAENLMIVDLIRADLASFCSPDSVSVPALMAVESYETVHQLVTTVCGHLKPGVGTSEAVRRCFPPGSMTGAPKRRSVQLLEQLELSPAAAAGAGASAGAGAGKAARRGIYSGALGWMGLDGAADFSVVIRTLVVHGDQLSIGAGGAITYLSDPDREWTEVLDKVGALATIRTV